MGDIKKSDLGGGNRGKGPEMEHDSTQLAQNWETRMSGAEHVEGTSQR